jgi:hypothetical protein
VCHKSRKIFAVAQLTPPFVILINILKMVAWHLTAKAGLDRNIAVILNFLKDWLLLESNLNHLLGKTMQYDNDRAIAVLAKALSVCRGVLYSARTGDASQSNIERLLESTGEAIAFAKVP